MARKKTRQKLTWVQYPLVDRSETLGNPYCGIYSIYKFFAHCENLQDAGDTIEKSILHCDQSLCLIEINLVRYNESSLTEEALDNVRQIFAFFADHGKEMIVRFVYDWDGNGLQNEPKNIGIILEHMQQLSPILINFAKSIYILQGLFIGSWGEMHNTRYITERSLVSLARQLYQCSGGSVYIAVRCPSIWRTIFKTYEPLSGPQAYTDSMQAHFCLFNDGILASDTDNGTYGNIARSVSTDYGDKLTRFEELKFQEKLCDYVPNGGETVNPSEDNDFAATCRAFSQMHISYLNGEYDPEVLNKWKETKTGLRDKPWKDTSVYDYIAAHLGYRFSIEKIAVSMIKDRDKQLHIKIQLINSGFSCGYRRYDVSLVIRDATYTQVYTHPVDTDTRRWLPGAPVALDEDIDFSQWTLQEYILGLKITDPQSRKHIRLANSFSDIDYSGIHSLGCIQISNC